VLGEHEDKNAINNKEVVSFNKLSICILINELQKNIYIITKYNIFKLCYVFVKFTSLFDRPKEFCGAALEA
jgi:hypothetical protein